MYGERERLVMKDGAAEILHAKMEMTQVTADNCELLIDNIADYHRQAQMFLRGRTA